MSAVFTLAGLTIKEAIRRRVFLAALLIAGLYLLFAFLPLHVKTGLLLGFDMATARNNLGRLLTWLGCGTIKFFGSVLAVTLAAGAISAEVDRGVLSVVVPKPLPRAAIYIGKWLGLVTLLAVSVTIWAMLLAFAIWHQTQTFHPRLFLGVLSAALFPLLFTTLTLCFSSFATYALSAGLALIAAGVALAEDMLHTLSRVLKMPLLDTLSRISGDLVPIGRMNHWISRGLDATGLGAAPPDSAGLDFSLVIARFDPSQAAAVAATSARDLWYILGYIAAFFVLGLIVFQRRDL